MHTDVLGMECGGQRTASGVIPQVPPTLFFVGWLVALFVFETGSLTDLEVFN